MELRAGLTFTLREKHFGFGFPFLHSHERSNTDWNMELKKHRRKHFQSSKVVLKVNGFLSIPHFPTRRIFEDIVKENSRSSCDALKVLF